MSLEDEIKELTNPKMEEIARKLAKIIEKNAPKDTGELANSVNIYEKDGQMIIKVEEEHAKTVEKGREGGVRPPIQPLKGWARRKLGSEEYAYAVQEKIAQEGTEAQPFVKESINQIKNEVR